MRSIFFTMMSYPELPEPDDEYSSWVTPQQKWWDPEVGNRAYNKYLNELEYADAVGFDAIGINEHHNCAYTMMPSPNLWAASIARRTENAAIAVLGNTLTNYYSPIRVAEEMAMIDAVSGGRLISGFVPGTTMDTAYSSSVNPSHVRQRFMEAADLVVKAWKAEEPFEFNGRFWQLRYVDPWPRVVQDPHPPIWCPAGGSPETWEFAAARNYVYAYLSFGGLQAADKLNTGYWETVKGQGREPNPFSLAANQFVFVADSMKEAEELYGPCIDYFWKRVLKFDPRFAGAPGYLSERAVRMAIGSTMADAAHGGKKFEGATPGGNDPDLGSGKYSSRSMVDDGVLIAGSPDEVTERLIANATKYRIGNLVLNMAMGNMSEELTKYNIKNYAEKVMPNLRGIFEDEWEHEWWPRPLANRVPMSPLQADVVADRVPPR